MLLVVAGEGRQLAGAVAVGLEVAAHPWGAFLPDGALRDLPASALEPVDHAYGFSRRLPKGAHWDSDDVDRPNG